jgi:hypothetical protein
LVSKAKLKDHRIVEIQLRDFFHPSLCWIHIKYFTPDHHVIAMFTTGSNHQPLINSANGFIDDPFFPLHPIQNQFHFINPPIFRSSLPSHSPTITFTTRLQFQSNSASHLLIQCLSVTLISNQLNNAPF